MSIFVAPCVAVRDAVAEVDITSHGVFKSHSFKKERYKARPFDIGMTLHKPKWQKILCWYPVYIPKQYTSTFVALDVKFSGELDVKFGRHTIEEADPLKTNMEFQGFRPTHDRNVVHLDPEIPETIVPDI